MEENLPRLSHQYLVIPEGTVDSHQTTIIEIPPEYAGVETVYAIPKLSKTLSCEYIDCQAKSNILKRGSVTIESQNKTTISQQNKLHQRRSFEYLRKPAFSSSFDRIKSAGLPQTQSYFGHPTRSNDVGLKSSFTRPELMEYGQERSGFVESVFDEKPIFSSVNQSAKKVSRRSECIQSTFRRNPSNKYQSGFDEQRMNKPPNFGENFNGNFTNFNEIPSNQIPSSFNINQSNFNANHSNFNTNQQNFNFNQPSCDVNQPSFDVNQSNFKVNQTNFIENPTSFIENSTNFIENPSSFIENPTDFIESNMNRHPLNLNKFPPSLNTYSSNLNKPLDMNRRPANVNKHPSNLNKHHSNLNKHPSNLNKHPSSLSKHPSNLNKHPSNLNKNPSNLNKRSSNMNKHPSSINKHATGNDFPGFTPNRSSDTFRSFYGNSDDEIFTKSSSVHPLFDTSSFVETPNKPSLVDALNQMYTNSISLSKIEADSMRPQSRQTTEPSSNQEFVYNELVPIQAYEECIPVPAFEEIIPVQARKESVPAYKESNPDYKECMPAYKVSLPAYKESLPAYNQPVPAYQQSTPIQTFDQSPLFPTYKQTVPVKKGPIKNIYKEVKTRIGVDGITESETTLMETILENDLCSTTNYHVKCRKAPRKSPSFTSKPKCLPNKGQRKKLRNHHEVAPPNLAQNTMTELEKIEEEEMEALRTDLIKFQAARRQLLQDTSYFNGPLGEESRGDN